MGASNIDRVPADLGAVNLGESWEIRYWCNHFNSSVKAIQAAMNKIESINTEEIAAYLESEKNRRAR